MGFFRQGLLPPCRRAACVHALSSALLALSGSFAAAAGLMPARTQPALHVQFQQDRYGRYPQDQYRPDQRGPDDRQDRYGQDRYGQDPYGRDRYGQDRRGQDYAGQDRYGQQGGGRGGSYQQSCDDVRQEGSILSAVCGDGRGRRFESSIDVNRCGRSDIGNSRGYLQCGNTRASGRQVN